MYIVRGLSFHFCFWLLTIWFSPDHKWSLKKMETFWFFAHWFPRTLDCAYDSNFLFSRSHRRSHDSAYDSNSDSVAGENQHLVTYENKYKKSMSINYIKNQGLYKRYISSYQKTPLTPSCLIYKITKILQMLWVAASVVFPRESFKHSYRTFAMCLLFMNFIMIQKKSIP